MTIASTQTYQSYGANNSTRIFAVPFYFLADADLSVSLISLVNGRTFQQVLNTDYTVSGSGVLTGGSVTFTTAPTADYYVTIARTVPFTQLTDYVQDDAFPAESHEKALDKLTMICQQINGRIDTLILQNGQTVVAGTNVGGGAGVLQSVSGSNFYFRTITGTGVTQNLDTISINIANLLATANNWTGGQQLLEFTLPVTPTSVDHNGWAAYVHDIASNTDNVVALCGHAYHDGAFTNVTGSYWGLATEAWSNQNGGGTLIGGELSVISQYPLNTNPIVGANVVFKNRSDSTAFPPGSVTGQDFNRNSTGLLITSQARPLSGTGHSGVGSGWQTAIRIGDTGFGSGLDWEGGSFYPGSTTYKAYSTIIDMTNALQDLAGGFPWFALYKNSATYWGMRFNGMLTGQLLNFNFTLNAGGTGYAVGNAGTIAGGTGATYLVDTVAAGVVTKLHITAGGSGYAAATGVTTAATSGAGTGLKLNLVIPTGCLYGGWLGVTAGGTGYVVGDSVFLNGGTGNAPVLQVTSVASGAVTGFVLLTPDNGNTYTYGAGHTVGTGKTTTAITGVGTGFTVSISFVRSELMIGGEKWEWWRMLNPSNPGGSGARHGYIDASFPGTPLTISATPFTFPLDGAL